MQSRMLQAAIPAMFAFTPAAAAVPSGVARQLPSGYDVLSSASMQAGAPARTIVIVALGHNGGSTMRYGEVRAPARPLLLFAQSLDGTFTRIGRNDTVVDRADEGGQCDPFLDGDGIIAVRGRYFTVQNGVACGQHWTDYITFRFDDARGGFVFDNEQSEVWKLNPSNDPNAEALVRDGPHRVRHAKIEHFVSFDSWRPER